MAIKQATVINAKGDRKAVDVGSKDAFAGGYKLETAPPTPATPTSTAAQTPSGTLPALTAPGNEAANFKTAFASAMNDAAAARKKDQLATLEPYMQGLSNSDLGSTIASIRQGANVSAEGLYKIGSDSFDKAQELAAAKVKDGFSTFNQLIQNKALLGIDNTALLAMEKSLGLPEGTMLAAKTELEAAKKLGNEDAVLDQLLKKSQIKENEAQASAAGRSNRGTTEKKNPLTISEASALGLPPSLVGKDQNELLTDIDSTNAPQWFLDYKGQQSGQSIAPGSNYIKREWSTWQKNFQDEYYAANDKKGTDSVEATKDKIRLLMNPGK